MEMDVPPEERVTRADYGFPVVAVPARHFWLCAACARLFRIKRWTRAGLDLEPLPPQATPERPPVKIAPARAAAPRRKVAFGHGA